MRPIHVMGARPQHAQVATLMRISCKSSVVRLRSWKKTTKTSAEASEILSALAESPYRDAACCGVSIAGALALVKSFDLLATGKVIDQVA